MKKVLLIGLLVLTTLFVNVHFVNADIENLNTWTESDPFNRFVINATTVAITTITGSDTDTFVYKDFGVNFFSGDFSVDFDLLITASVGSNQGIFHPILFSNIADDYKDIFLVSGSAVGVRYLNSGLNEPTTEDGYLMLLIMENGVWSQPFTHIHVNRGDKLYLRYSRVGKLHRLTSYTDDSRTTSISSITKSTSGTYSWRYISLPTTYGWGGDTVSGYIQNADAGVEYGPPTWSSPSASSSSKLRPCIFSTTWTSSIGLSKYIFSWNGTGVWTNNTVVSFPGGNPASATASKILPNENKIQYRFYANDTSDQWNVTAVQTLSLTNYGNIFDLNISNGTEGYLYVTTPYIWNFTTLVSGDYVLKFNFTDGVNELILVTYTNSTGIVTIPSGEELLTITRVDTTTNTTGYTFVAFTILLTSKVADIANIDVNAHITYMSDWVTFSNIVSIYNIGGYVTYTDSGWAGHTEGGDVFDIYAADTRVADVLPRVSFGPGTTILSNIFSSGPSINDAMPNWVIVQPNPAYSNITFESELKPSVAHPFLRPGATPYPYSGANINEAAYSMRMRSSDISNYKVFAKKQFTRQVDDEFVIYSFFWMSPSNSTNYVGKTYVSDQDNYMHGAWTASYFEWTGTNLFYRNNTKSFQYSIYNATYYTWYNITLSHDIINEYYNLTIRNLSGAILAEEDNISFYDKTHVEYLGWITLKTEDAGAGTQSDFYIDGLSVHTDWEGLYGGYARAEMVYKDFQHIHLAFGYGIEPPNGIKESGMGQGNITFGFDSFVNGNWVEEVRVKIYPWNVTQGRGSGYTTFEGSAVGTRNNWIRFKVEWYQRGVLVKTEYVYALYEGDPRLNIQQRNVVSFFLDIWINKADGSSWVGGRINPEWYGLDDVTPWWGFWYNDWKPKVTDTVVSSSFKRLVNNAGTTISIKSISLTRIYAEVYRSNVSTFHHNIQATTLMEIKSVRPNEVLAGVSTPILTETKIPQMTQTNFLAPLYTAISSIGAMVMNAFVGAATALISIIDWLIFVVSGQRGIFSSIMSMLGQWFAVFGTWMGYFTDQISNIISFVTITVTWTLTFAGWVMNTVIWFSQNTLYLFIFPIQILFAFFTGGTFTLPYTNIVADFSGSYPIVVALITLVPIFTMIFFLQWFIQDGLFAIPGKVIGIFNTMRALFEAMFWIFEWIWKTIEDLYRLILNHIPFLG